MSLSHTIKIGPSFTHSKEMISSLHLSLLMREKQEKCTRRLIIGKSMVSSVTGCLGQYGSRLTFANISLTS